MKVTTALALMVMASIGSANAQQSTSSSTQTSGSYNSSNVADTNTGFAEASSSLSGAAGVVGGLEAIVSSVQTFAADTLGGGAATPGAQSIGVGDPRDGQVTGAFGNIASANLPSGTAQRSQGFWDVITDALENFKMVENIERATSTMNKAITMANQGFEILRIAGDPAALAGALGFEQVSELMVNAGEVYANGQQLYEMGLSLSGDGSVGIMSSLTSGWTGLANVNTPEEVIQFARRSKYYGSDVFRSRWEGLQTSLASFGKTREELMVEYQNAREEFANAKDEAQRERARGKMMALGQLMSSNDQFEVIQNIRLMCSAMAAQEQERAQSNAAADYINGTRAAQRTSAQTAYYDAAGRIRASRASYTQSNAEVAKRYSSGTIIEPSEGLPTNDEIDFQSPNALPDALPDDPNVPLVPSTWVDEPNAPPAPSLTVSQPAQPQASGTPQTSTPPDPQTNTGP